MTTKKKPAETVRLGKQTIRLMRKRREWRCRALGATIKVVTWPAGKPEREEVEREAIKCMNKIGEWFREPRARLVIAAVQRRAVQAWSRQINGGAV